LQANEIHDNPEISALGASVLLTALDSCYPTRQYLLTRHVASLVSQPSDQSLKMPANWRLSTLTDRKGLTEPTSLQVRVAPVLGGSPFYSSAAHAPNPTEGLLVPLRRSNPGPDLASALGAIVIRRSADAQTSNKPCFEPHGDFGRPKGLQAAAVL
jgi:hypothetical protein